MLDTHANGVYIIAATPFTDDGAVDTASLDRLMDFYIGCGITGVTVLGIMGEAPKLTHAESVALTRQVVRRVNGLPVVVGASAPGFASMGALAKDVMDAGAGGVMVAPPSTLKTDDQIVAYYAQAADAIGADVPFVIQDYPQASGVMMAPSTIRRIVEAHASCAMLKHEDWPGLEKLTAVRRLMAEGAMRRVSILTGNGGVFLDFEMERGADGAMTGYAFPDMLVDVVRLQKAGERDAAHDLFDAHLPLMRYEQQPGPGLAVRKHILKLRGAILSDAQRKPASVLSPIARSEVAYLLARLARHDARARGLGQLPSYAVAP